MKDKIKSILIAEVIAVWGIKGAVKIHSYAENPKSIFTYSLFDIKSNSIKLLFLKETKKQLICSINNCNNRNGALKYIGTKLYVSRVDLPNINNNEEYYINDLIGIKVLNNQKEEIGIVKFVYNFGASDIIEIEFSNQTIEMFAFNQHNFTEVNNSHIVLNLPIDKRL